MLGLPTIEQSYWKEFLSTAVYPEFSEDLNVDVVVVGGGITGLTAAYLLKQLGHNVAVLEKNTLASGTSGGTTGKVTSQHGLIYAELTKIHGLQTAGIYAEANQTAVKRIAAVIKKEKIDCDWQRADNYVFTTDSNKIQQFKNEAKTAATLGLPASFETKLELPFNIAGAVKFANQAYFHTPKYVHGLAKAVHGIGSYVYENSNVTSFHDGVHPVVKTKQATVHAKDIIIATKMPAFPLIGRFTCALQEYPHTSYIVAGHLEKDLKGMYISPDKNHYSILPVISDSNKLLLIGGRKHIPGLGSPRKRHQQLADYAEKYFGIKSIDYRWKAMDYLAYDSVPLIGKLYPWSKHMYVATGFKKWGLSSSMVAGAILSDLITGQENSWATTFDSLRLKPMFSIPRTLAKNIASQ